MVSSYSLKQPRDWVPALGILALIALFLKLPETPHFFGYLGCKTCSSSDPYLPLIGAGYFSILVAVSLIFPNFPGPLIARGGLLWAVLLAAAMTYVNLPGWCTDCLIGHLCNILIWTIWVVVPPIPNKAIHTTVRERLCLVMFAPIAVVALFSCLNLTFMAYGFKINKQFSPTSFKVGETVPVFSMETNKNRSFSNNDLEQAAGIVINFVASNCPYCKEQLPILNDTASHLANDSYRFINISPELPQELVQLSPETEWVLDKESKLRDLFKVTGYPTLFIVGGDGKIVKIIPGVPSQLKDQLLTSF
jgi:thiol-disulfide isomerase/thioredoxin